MSTLIQTYTPIQCNGTKSVHMDAYNNVQCTVNHIDAMCMRYWKEFIVLTTIVIKGVCEHHAHNLFFPFLYIHEVVHIV